ncbi:5-epiaristolochene 1,3-dihydroxylase-like [Phalaenopsis equestris]|uniref:5-epiaristolochene 1,3-dihydroxylase-like n=1 Tax=Phalaenopsis equestris TaxID=78828 RepID=UPI0009E3A639|nr:5-epiaristolochene 1,3-dihydroxylase-like [Phalaenopsis equestris]
MALPVQDELFHQLTSTSVNGNSNSNSFLSVFLLLLLPYLLIIFLRSRARSSYNHYKNNFRLPPGPSPLPIIGSLHKLFGQILHIAFRRLSKEHGPLMHLLLGQTSTIIASSQEVASEILRNQDTVFCSRPRLSAVTHFSYGGLDIGASPFGEGWKKLRRFGSNKMFNPGKVQSFSFIRQEEVSVMVGSIAKRSLQGKMINFSEIAMCLFNNITFREVFSKRASPDGECLLSPHYNLIMRMMTLMTEFNVRDFFPSFWWLDFLTGWRFKIERCFRAMDRVFEKEINLRLKQHANNIYYGDFLDDVLKRQKELDPSLGYLFSRKEMKALLMDMFLGGSDTSCVTLEWAMTELIRNPAAIKRAQEEVRRVGRNRERLEESDMEELQYLKMVVKETLRLHPPTTLLAPRECMKDTQIHGYDIPKKTLVIINAWAIGRDPKYWDEAEVFRPERFELKKVNFKGNHFEFIPFGSGRRICPGMTLGLASIELALANILYSFDWELPFGMTEKDVDMGELFGLSTHKKKPLLLAATPAVNAPVRL